MVKRLDQWSINPGFHPHCSCTLDYVGEEDAVGEPTIYISILDFPILQIWAEYNPIRGNLPPLMFPLCPFISGTRAAASPIVMVPLPDAMPVDLDVPVIVGPPPMVPTVSVAGVASASIGAAQSNQPRPSHHNG